MAVGVLLVGEKLKISLPSTGLTYEQLKEIERTTERRQDRPEAIPLDQIHTAEDVFQPRILVGSECVDPEHVRSLLAPLRDHRIPLGRILVTPIGDRWFVVDGHHRLAAYIAFGLEDPVPVDIFEGDVDAAEAKAVGENSKDKLPMSKDSKLEKAWVLTLRQVHTIALIVGMTTVSGRTVSNMRTRMRELGEDAVNYTWKQAKRGEMTQEDFDFDAWIEQEADEMAQRVCKVHNKKVLLQPEVFARMVEKVNPQMIQGMLERWIGDHHHLFKQLVDEMEQMEALDI